MPANDRRLIDAPLLLVGDDTLSAPASNIALKTIESKNND
jgi:hypothetical protein